MCEISFSTLRKDARDVERTLESEGVLFYWIVDANNDHLIVHELIDPHLVVTSHLFREDGLVGVPPFEAVELSMGHLLEDDPD